MKDEDWASIEELFHHAAALDGSARAAFLNEACAGKPEVRLEVESLLAADAPDTDLAQLVHGALARAVDDLTPEDSNPEGKRIGSYRIICLIAKGGMGAVYRATREDDFHMHVAIKLIKGGMDTEAAITRFRNKRQILAGLQHVNIARLLDGGITNNGRPYFVMEYIDGKPLLEYAAPLSIRQRLSLFVPLCSAVEHAHRKRVVHRDIKPANILVTADGIPKLLDFGIAKLLDPSGGSSTMTLAGAHMMTPDYASPEQVRGEPVTPATDVYSLGAVLYELLTCRRVHEFETLTPRAIEREVCTREPEKPSAVAKDLDSDLDNIVLMALRKEPARRYSSAAELGEDIERYLQHRTIVARKESAWYRGRKFCQRNRALLATAATTALIVLV